MAKLFEVGTRAQFDALKAKDNNVMYWLTDTQELYKGDIRYAVGKEASNEYAGLMSAEDKALLDTIREMMNTADNSGIALATASVGVDEGAMFASYDGVASDMAYTPAVMDMAELNGMIAAYDNWEKDKVNYPWYGDDVEKNLNNQYSDDNYSYIDENKTIKVDKGQINISQESHAQFIPFEMKRYYDGIDLAQMTISMIYVNKNGEVGNAKIINMQYGTDAIRFAWLVDEAVTYVVGSLQFEVQARGWINPDGGTWTSPDGSVQDKGGAYIWKSRVGSGISVIQSLTYDGEIEIDDSWMTELVQKIASRVAEQITDAGIEGMVTQAEAARDAAQSARDEAIQAKNEAQTIAETKATEVVNNAVGEINNRIDTISQDLDDTKTNLSNTENSLSEEIQNVKDSIPVVPTKVGAFENDAGYLTEHQSLEAYAKKEELPIVPTKVGAFENDAGYLVQENLNGLASEEFVNTKIAEADISDKLVNYPTKEEMEEAIGAVDVSEQLKDYAKAENVYDKTTVDNKDKVVQDGVDANTKKISDLSEVVTSLQEQMGNLDVDQKYTYDVAYNDKEDPEIGENVFVLYEIQNEGQEDEKREIKSKFTIVGGSGTGTSSSLKIEYITTTPVVATLTDKVELFYRFSGTDSSGDSVMEGDTTWKVNGSVVATGTAVYGENSFDVTDYLVLGTQKVVLSIVDAAGSLVTKTWTVQKIDVRLECDFNDTLTYPIGTVSFDYTPYGAISKEVHFKLDGEELESVITSASGIPTAYTLPAQEHGAHLVEAWITATVNNNTIESNHIFKDVIWYDENSTVPVIGTIYQEFTAKQYDATNISYVVYDPTTETPTVTRRVNDEDISTSVMTTNTDVWQYKTSEVGIHNLAIVCGETVKPIKATIEKLDIEINPVTAGLMFDFNPSGKSNNDADKLWSYNNGNQVVSMTVSDDFDWVNGGYQIDDNGDQYFCIKAGTKAEINYKLFEDDAKKNGKEFKLIFKSTNVQSADANFLSCIDNTTEDNHIGIEMNVHEAYIYGQAGKLHLPYSEEDIIEFEFNISKDTESIPMVMGYEDGVSTCPMVYDGSYNFTQNTPKIITLGSDYCDLHIYRFKVYNTSLDSRGILNNFIADARNAEEIINRYNRNQIYDENNQLTPEFLASKCPQLRIIQLEAPYFTNSKDEKVGGTTIKYTYKNGDPILDNWIATDCVHAGQGTSSNNYGASGRNLDLIMKTYKDYGNTPVITLGDGKTTVSKVSLTRNSVESNYFNVKVNIASSENANNALLQKRYNEFNPYKRPFVREDETQIPKIKDTMEFYNCVVFIRETDTTQDAQGNYTTHREFNDTNWHFYAIGNIGDSKKTDSSRLTDPDDRYECINEIVDVEKPLSDFPVGEEALKILEAEGFDKEDFVVDGVTVEASYEWRYIWEDDEDDTATDEVAEYCKQKWIEMYKFVTQSTDEDFKAHFGDYFVLDSALYYYLFTERYTMVDNRAKNLFLHYGKTGEVDSEGNPVRKWDFSFDYDNDTALGINNYGDMVYRYGYEDTDVQDGTNTEVFRESDSTLFCRIRDNFREEMMELYKTLESKNAWHGESLISEFDVWQDQFPEELWRVDIERKYTRTYNSSFINGAGDPQFLNNMAHGKKKYQRRQYERDQEQYMASKHQTTLAFADSAVLRCEVPEGDLVVAPNYKFKLTPYNYMYLNVQYGNGSTPIQLRAEPNKEYEIPFEGNATDIVNIYSASMLKSLGDLSPSYPATVSTPTADKLTILTIGNKIEGYDNSSLTSVTLGSNDLLEELNLANVSAFNQSLDLSVLKNLKRLYAHGSSITGVVFADGGKLEIAELPAIGSLTLKNLIYLSELNVTSWEKLTSLIVENCPAVDLLSILGSANSLNRLRLIGVNWTLEDDALLDRFMGMTGIDGNGYNTTQSVITGSVFVPMVKEQKLAEYNKAWPDLQISYNTLVEQFTVTFVNDDDTVLDVQYIDKGLMPVDPVTRENNPINIPTKESTVSTDYTYAGWDSEFIAVFAHQTYKAIYTEKIREYTVKYVAMNAVKYEAKGKYNEVIPYVGDIPTYTAEESGYRYYLFSHWDKSGLIDGDKTINAVFDTFSYVDGYFDNKDFSELRPVEIYGMTQMGLHQTYAVPGDSVAIALGNDYDYPDIETKLLISEKTDFNGKNYIDTGVSLFDEDRDFVLAIDYTVSSDSATNGVLAQCYSDNGARGFRMHYNSSVRLNWNTAQVITARPDRREMLVIRHIKGDSNLYVYGSNAENNVQHGVITKAIMENTLEVNHESTIVFGCARSDDGVYENNIIGSIYWSKLWYIDLGEKACEELAAYPHEKMNLIVADQRRFYLADVPNKRSTITFVADKPLWNPLAYTNTSYSEGWLNGQMNAYLNSKVYNGFPIQWRQLLKKCSVKSLAGRTSTEIVEDASYIIVPAAADMSNSDRGNSNVLIESPYVDEISPASSCLALFTDNDSRILYHENGKAISYWTRTPCYNASSWQFSVQSDGGVYAYQSPYSVAISEANKEYMYVRIMVSI